MNKLPKLKLIKNLARIPSEKSLNILQQLKESIEAELPNSNVEEQLKLLEYLEILLQTDLAEESLTIVENICNLKFYKEPVIYTYGDNKEYGYDGKAYSEVIAKVIEPLTWPITYINFLEKSWNLLASLYLKSFEDERLKEVRGGVKDRILKISEYKLYPESKGKGWRYFTGYPVQKFILEKVLNDLLPRDKSLSIEILGNLLSLEQEGQYSTSRILTLNWSEVSPNEVVKSIRVQSIDSLLKLLEENSDNTELTELIFKSLDKVTSFPRNSYSDELETMVIENVKSVITGYTKIIEYANPLVIKSIEKDILWYRRRFKNEISSEVDMFHKALSKNTFYNDIYKLLAKHDFEFEEELLEYEKDSPDWEKMRSIRRERVKKLVQEVDESNIDEWVDKLIEVLKYLPENYGGLIFYEFLEEVGRNSPIAYKLANKLLEKEFIYTYLIAVGLRKKSDIEKSNMLVKKIINSKNKEVSKSVAQFFYVLDKEFLTKEDFKFLTELYESTKDLQEDWWYNYRLFMAALALRQIEGKDNINSLLIDILKDSNKAYILRYIDSIHMSDHRKHMVFEDLSDEVIDLLVESLVEVERLDYDAEDFASRIFVRRGVDYFIDFFERRITKERELVDGKKGMHRIIKYDSIPYEFVATDSERIIKSENYKDLIQKIIDRLILKENPKEEYKYMWEGANLIHAIDRKFENETADILIEILNKNVIYARAVGRIINDYHGYFNNKDKVMIMLINKYVQDEEIRERVSGALFSTGVVSGEDGFLNALKSKLNRVEEWLKETKNKDVKNFLEDQAKKYKAEIAVEGKRVEEKVALRDLDFEDDDDE